MNCLIIDGSVLKDSKGNIDIGIETSVQLLLEMGVVINLEENPSQH